MHRLGSPFGKTGADRCRLRTPRSAARRKGMGMKALGVLVCMGISCAAQGSGWKALGIGVGTTGNDVYALAVFDSKLIVGGNFVTAGGQEANRIAAWDGESWYPFGGGTNSAVYALTVYNDELIAGGAF